MLSKETVVLSEFITGFNLLIYNDSKSLRSKMLVGVHKILKFPICIGEGKQALTWLQIKEWGGSVKRASTSTGASSAMLCDSWVKNTRGGTYVFKCTKCTTKRINKRRAYVYIYNFCIYIYIYINYRAYSERYLSVIY